MPNKTEIYERWIKKWILSKGEGYKITKLDYLYIGIVRWVIKYL